jgi:hypothetical protein
MIGHESSIQPANVTLYGDLFKAYRREGFDAGYRQATQDLLACLVLKSEQFIAEHPRSDHELRKLIYTFVDRLERQIDRNAANRGFVEGGLGI